MSAGAVSVDVVDLGDGVHPLEAEFVALVARALPGVPGLAGRWTVEVRPQRALVARVGGAVVGVRMVLTRDVVVRGRTRSVIGTGIAVDPLHQRRGVGHALTRAVVALAVAEARAAVVAVLATDNARAMLVRHHFAPLAVPVRFGAVDEAAPVYVYAVDAGFVADVNVDGALDLGAGLF